MALKATFLLTKDGHIVCFHDQDTQAYHRQKTPRQKHARSQSCASSMSAHGKASNTKARVFPTIAEVLATVPDGKKIYIEIKCGAGNCHPPATRDRGKHPRQENQILSSFVLRHLVFSKPSNNTLPIYKLPGSVDSKKTKSGKVHLPTRRASAKPSRTFTANGFSSSHQHIKLGSDQAKSNDGRDYATITFGPSMSPAIATRFQPMGHRLRSLRTNPP